MLIAVWCCVQRCTCSYLRIASVSHWNRYTFGTELVNDSYLKYDAQGADPMELVAGETYLLIAITKEGGGNDYIRVSIIEFTTMFGFGFAEGCMM